MLTEAIASARAGDNSRAKELLTRLLRVDSANPEYWLWMSTVVDSERERIYCLQSVLKHDPTNRAALRGLTILGAHEPGDAELSAQLKVPHRKIIPPKRSSPINIPGGSRLALVLIPTIALVVVIIAVGIIFQPRSTSVAPTLRPPTETFTPTPATTPTFTPVPIDSVLERTAVPPHVAETPFVDLLGLSPTATPYWGFTTNSVYEAYTSSVNAYKRGEYQSSIQLMEQVISLDPNLPDAYFVRAEAYMQLGLIADAQVEYERTLQLSPNMAAALLGMGRIQLLADPEILPEAYDLALINDPHLLPAYLEKMEFLSSHGQWEALRETALAAIGSGTKPPAVYVQMAEAQFHLGQLEEALRSILFASSADASILKAYLLQGQILNALHRFDESISPLKTYLVYSPDEVSAWIALANSLFNLGDWGAAEDAYTQVLSFQERNFSALLNRGRLYLEGGRIEEALVDFDIAREIDPNSVQLLLDFARLYFILEEDQLAMTDLDQLIQSSSNPSLTAEAHSMQASYYMELIPPDLSNALASWQKIIDLEGVSQEKKDEARDEMFRVRNFHYPVPHL
jgi:tetratricopeptide (TPR) repeat protein